MIIWDLNKAVDIWGVVDLGRWSVREVLLYLFDEMSSYALRRSSLRVVKKSSKE